MQNNFSIMNNRHFGLLLLAATIVLAAILPVFAYSTGEVDVEVSSRETSTEWWNGTDDTVLIRLTVHREDMWSYNVGPYAIFHGDKTTNYRGKPSNPCSNSGCPRPDLPTGHLLYSTVSESRGWRAFEDPEILEIPPRGSVYFRINDDRLGDNGGNIDVEVEILN